MLERGWLASGGHLVEVLLAVELLLSLVKRLQNLLDDGLQCTTQVFTTVRLSKRRHVDESRAAVTQVQRRVVGEVTEISVREGNRVKSTVKSAAITQCLHQSAPYI